MLTLGDDAPSFCLLDKDITKIYLNDFKGKWIILYFYPRDNTSGCTREALDFTQFQHEFNKLNAIILGVSPDSVKSHSKFIEKHNLGIILLSDTEHIALEKYGVWQLKKMYGREYYGVVRCTFLINPEGKISHLWRKVKVKGHIEDVKKKLEELSK